MMADELPRVLIVDDEVNIGNACVKILAKNDLEVNYVKNGHDALAMMKAISFDVVVTDLKMSRMGGMELLKIIKERYPNTKVIVITGYASISSAVEVMKLGAFDYLPKPFTPVELRSVVQQALSSEPLRAEQASSYSGRQIKMISHQLVGRNHKIKQIVSMIQKVAPTDSTVLIYGESGTGKELVARAVHANSNRKDEVFFAVDCGTLSDNLLSGELFGHVRGAFTGAYQDKDGIFKRANKGTVFLDEIGNISYEIQGKLLRFLENREFIPVGGAEVQKVNLRLIFATNQDLARMVETGKFRKDFYYRIMVYPINTPPLRDILSDLPEIAERFLRLFAKQMNKPVNAIAPEAIQRLMLYDWPGNVRQLKNVIERAVILSEGEILESIHFPEVELAADVNGPESVIINPENLLAVTPVTNEELKQKKQELRQQVSQQLEKNFILNALIQHNWNVTLAAEKVGIQRTNFQALMKRHGIRRPPK
ncbi:sigma-54-dependent transcriptional regulator [Desulfobacterium sp. N47]